MATRTTSNGTCADGFLNAYPDSLDYLIRSHRLEMSTQIIDSLLLKYGEMNCPNVILIRAAQANVYERHFDYETALEIYHDELKKAQKFSFTKEEITIRLSLARVYEIIERPELSKSQMDEALELINTHGLDQYLPRYYVRMSSYLRVYSNEEKELAKAYADTSVTLGEQYGDYKSVAGGFLLLGLIADDPDESVYYLKRASSLLYELGDYIGSMFQERNIAHKFLNHGEFQMSLDVLQRIDPHIVKYPGQKKVYYQLQMSIVKVKADAFEGLGQKDSVIVALKQYNKYSQLLGDYVNQEKINQLVIENVVRQEQERLAATKQQIRWLTIGLLLLACITFIVLRLYTSNRRKKQKIEEQTQTITRQLNELQEIYNYQSTLLSEVHHRIKNNLQLIISLLILQKAKLSGASEQQFLEVLSHRISSIALIHEQLYNLKEFEKVDVELYTNELLRNLLSLASGNEVKIEKKVDNIHLNLETITPLGLIWSELVSNSLKYNPTTKGLKIFFELREANGVFKMHYYDNGNGYPEGEFQGNTKGIGFTIIQSLSRQLAGKTTTYNQDGAHFTLEFKEKIISPL